MRIQKGEILKKILSVASLATCLISSAFADNHGSAPEGNGAFTTLFVAAKDVESYIESVKSNPALFEMICAEAAGYCETISGRDYVGQLMLWNAFPSVTSAIVGASKYDPSKAPADMASQREFKYGATWAPLKPFPRLDPGYERAMRIKVSQRTFKRLLWQFPS